MCAVADGRVYCWGDNPNGQLGSGRSVASRSRSPRAVDTAGVLAGEDRDKRDPG